jgi:anti-sigma regulatory factor (Ser/Thr protein kinase)
MNTNPDYTVREITTSFPSSRNMVSPIRNFIGETIESFGFQKLRTKIELCVEEIVSNIIEHAYLNDPNYKIDLRMVVSSRMIELSFAEKGIPFDPSMVKPFDYATLQGGLGTTLVKSLTDKYEFENLGREGKRITISFITQQPEKPSVEGEDKSQNVLTIEPVEITYSRLIEDDAIQLSRLAWLNYGYSYEDYIYYPDEIKMKLRKNSITAFAAWHKDKLVGHIALKSDGGNFRFPELGVALVDPAYRRNNIFNKLNSAAVNYLIENNLDGFFVKAVTNHIISQKAAVDNLGMIPTNVQLCVLPENINMNNLENVKIKLSAITYSRLLKQLRRNIYIPEKYRELILKIYQWSEIEISEIKTIEKPIPQQNKFSVSLAKDSKSAFISFEEIGDGFELIIKNQLKEIGDEGYHAIFLYLSLSSPLLCSTIEFLNRELFIFAGIQFNYFNQSDALVLQRIENIDIDFSMIKIYSEEGKFLLQQIENEYNQRNI